MFMFKHWKNGKKEFDWQITCISCTHWHICFQFAICLFLFFCRFPENCLSIWHLWLWWFLFLVLFSFLFFLERSSPPGIIFCFLFFCPLPRLPSFSLHLMSSNVLFLVFIQNSLFACVKKIKSFGFSVCFCAAFGWRKFFQAPQEKKPRVKKKQKSICAWSIQRGGGCFSNLPLFWTRNQFFFCS